MKPTKQICGVTFKFNFFDNYFQTTHVYLSVIGTYTPAYMGSREDPPEDAEFEIESIDVAKGNLLHLLDEFETTAELQQAIIDKCIEYCQHD